MSLQVGCIIAGLIICIMVLLGVKAWEMVKESDKKDNEK